MRKTIIAFAFTLVLWSCKTMSTSNAYSAKEEVQVNINLIDIKDDKVLVTVKSPKIHTDEITYQLPKTVPGTYSEDNFGTFIDDFKAYDTKGNLLPIKKLDENSWSIANAKTLDKITYWVNDTFDTEKAGGLGSAYIFSPVGSNIDADKNVMLNTHCFVGYFTNYMSIPYRVNISHPTELWGATSMIDQDASATNDMFIISRYAELVENPIMYSKPDFTTFTIDDMQIQIAIYSPSGKFTAESISPDMKTMMTAQKHFLGNINNTKKYTVLLYLSSANNDAKGYGALEHPTATTVVQPETKSKEDLVRILKDVVSHEFFHIVTPLAIHSQEIQNFNYNNPKMSKHLWMYEGVTEYFANLFQINQGLISEKDFYIRMNNKINQANFFNDTIPITKMSSNVLQSPYKEQYRNVYQKGALIGMCLDIIIREKSNEKRGILDLMQQLSREYGASKAFNDDELFAKITSLTYPEVGDFLKTYVSGPTPIPYADYFAKVGVTKHIEKVPASIFGNKQLPFVKLNLDTKEISVISGKELIDFYKNLDLRAGDIFVAINDKPCSTDNFTKMISESKNWKENDPIILKIKRDGKELTITGNVKPYYEDKDVFDFTNTSKSALKEAWIKG